MRLLVELEDTDDFTYSCTYTIPMVYESAEKALVDIETEANRVRNAVNAYKVKMDVIHDKYRRSDGPKLVCHTEHAEELRQLFEKGKMPEHTFILGGAMFTISNLFSDDLFVAPRIMTVDEFFSKIEKSSLGSQ